MVGAAAIVTKAIAAAATLESAVVLATLMNSSRRFDVAPHDWVALSATEEGCAGMPAADHRFVSLPLAITGPVGRPVGEPPGGSSDTASVASAAIRCINPAGRLMWTG